MKNVYINLTEEDHPPGMVMLEIDDYTSVPLVMLSDMLDELIEGSLIAVGTPNECIDRGSAQELAPIIRLFAEFSARVAALHAACTPEIQAEVDASTSELKAELEAMHKGVGNEL